MWVNGYLAGTKKNFQEAFVDNVCQASAFSIKISTYYSKYWHVIIWFEQWLIVQISRELKTSNEETTKTIFFLQRGKGIIKLKKWKRNKKWIK